MFSSRAFKLALAVFSAAWLAVLVPAHRQFEATAAHAGGAVTDPHDDADHDSPALPHEHDAHCGVCLYAAGLGAPTPVAEVIPAPERAATMTERAPPALALSLLPTPIRGRAPPAA